MKIIIPARKGSKGLPGKNRILLEKTISTIPSEYLNLVYVVTDDPEIHFECIELGVKSIERPPETATDQASTKEVITWTLSYMKFHKIIEGEEDILMLYLTYPERTWKDVESGMRFYAERSCSSMLCRKEIKVSPYLILKSENDSKGSQLFSHDLYRRQDYPECFELSHFICIFNSSSINKLNNNLYNSDTIFMPIEETIDVDEKNDLLRYYDNT